MSTLIWIIILVILVIAWPYITRWGSQWLARRLRNRFRGAMGIPPEPKPHRETRSERKQREAEEQARTRERRYAERAAGPHTPIIPKEYAVDVEYTEYHEYSENTEIRSDDSGVHIVTESQVTDAEYVVIKPAGEGEEQPHHRKGFFKKSK